MGPVLAFAALSAALVTVRAAPGQGCPSGAQVREALRARLPGQVVPDDGGPARALAHVLVVAGATGMPEIELRDERGRVRLRRTLRPGEGGRPDCAALADTIALVVERHFAELALPAAAPSAPVTAAATTTPRVGALAMAVQAEARTQHQDLSALALGLGLRVHFGATRALFADATLSLPGPQSLAWQAPGVRPGRGHLQGGELELAVGARAPLGPGRVEGAVTVRLTALAASEEAGGSDLGFGQAVGARGGYRWPLGHRLFVGASLGVMLGLTRHEVVLPTRDVVTQTPRVFATLTGLLGVAF